MRSSRGWHGFGLVEVLVITVLILILAVILFPVFMSNRHGSYDRSRCLNHQRQINLAVMMYAQDHDELLPDAATVWQQIKLDKGTLVCDKAKKRANGYAYNSYVSGEALGEFWEPSQVMLTCDDAARAGGTPNVFADPLDVAWRHGGQAIASYLDGHVEMKPSLTPGWFGTVRTGITVGKDFNGARVGTSPSTLVYRPQNPPAGKPALDLAQAKQFSGSGIQVGAAGYVLCQRAFDSQAVRAPFIPVSTTGNWVVSDYRTPVSWAIDPALKDERSGGRSAAFLRLVGKESGTVTISFTGAAWHTITLICPKADGGVEKAYTIGVMRAGVTDPHEKPLMLRDDGCRDKDDNRATIYQITTRVPVILTFRNNDNAPSAACAALQAIFLD